MQYTLDLSPVQETSEYFSALFIFSQPPPLQTSAQLSDFCELVLSLIHS